MFFHNLHTSLISLFPKSPVNTIFLVSPFSFTHTSNSLVNSQDINIIKLRRLSRFRLETIQQQTRIKTQLTTCLDIVFPELSSFFKGNLHLKVSYALLEKYSSAKAIAHCRIDGLTNLLYDNSKGHVGLKLLFLFLMHCYLQLFLSYQKVYQLFALFLQK